MPRCHLPTLMIAVAVIGGLVALVREYPATLVCVISAIIPYAARDLFLAALQKAASVLRFEP